MLSRFSIAIVLAAASMAALAAPTDDASLRDAMARYERAWNQRDVGAWKELVTADLLYQETYLHTDPERQMNTRDRSLRAFLSGIEAFDFKWEVLRIQKKPDGSATAVMRVAQLALPRTGEKYAAIFETNPAIARWRIDNGKWRMYHFVTYKPLAREIVQTEGLQ